jgi:hypothetical protein
MIKAFGVALALLLLATTGWSQESRPAAHAFHVTWPPQTDRVLSRIRGNVRNNSGFRVTNVRLQIDGLDAEGRAVDRRFTWAIGDLVPGGETSFLFEPIPGAARYSIVVASFDIVSAPQAP